METIALQEKREREGGRELVVLLMLVYVFQTTANGFNLGGGFLVLSWTHQSHSKLGRLGCARFKAQHYFGKSGCKRDLR